MKHFFNKEKIAKDLKDIYKIDVKVSNLQRLMHSPARGVNILVLETDIFGTKIDTRYLQYFEVQDNEIVVKRRRMNNDFTTALGIALINAMDMRSVFTTEIELREEYKQQIKYEDNQEIIEKNPALTNEFNALKSKMLIAKEIKPGDQVIVRNWEY